MKPGDPGFEELAAKITPLNKIRKGLSVQTNGLEHREIRSGWKMSGTDRGRK